MFTLATAVAAGQHHGFSIVTVLCILATFALLWLVAMITRRSNRKGGRR